MQHPAQVDVGGGVRLRRLVGRDGGKRILGWSLLWQQLVAEAEARATEAQVRLVGADIEDIRKAKPSAEYLVEWDIPAEIDMETYLGRKKANAPKYAQVPEVSFLRTYVREDTVKCLCFYNAPDEDAVVRAREAVTTPIDRLHHLAGN